MDISTRVQSLTIEKRLILANRLKKELVSQSVDSSKNPSETGLPLSRDTPERSNLRLMHDGQHKQFSTLPTTQEKRQRLVAYLVLTADHTQEDRSTDSTYLSRSMNKDDVQGHEQGNNFAPSQFRNFLRKQLPEFMIPSMFVILEKLPRTNTGKVDYRTLPNPLTSEDRPDKHSAPPTTATQKQLQKIWASALGINQIGIHENFFELGGHSLLIAQVVSHIRSTIGVDIALRSLFDYPTIEALSEVIDTLLWTNKERIHFPDTFSYRETFEI